MARSKQTFAKKEKEDKRKKKRKEKEEKRLQRKANSNKGKGFDSMIAYVDEMGRITATPPDPSKRTELKLEDIQLGARKETDQPYEEVINTGRVSYFSDEKGYGFIKDRVTKESVFFHLSVVKTDIKLNDEVSFDKTRGPKGYTATSVTKIG
jgi:cold shock CspA family protein